ncbi:MAG: ABC transporter substrate-binding protein [Holosporales bacterium]
MLRRVFVSFLSFLISSPVFAANSPTVGVLQIIEHPALNQTRDGLLARLKENATTVEVQNAQGNPALAAQIAQKFVASGVKVIVALGTTAAQAAVSAAKARGVPVVFSSVTDPLGAKLVKDLKQPGLPVTGASNYIPSLELLTFVKSEQPQLKRLGVIYNPGEANSVSTLNEMQKVAKALGFEVVAVSATKSAECVAAAQNLAGSVEAILIHNDNTALSAFEAIAKVAKKAQLPLYASDHDVLPFGATATYGPDQYALGVQTAEMVLEVLGGRRPEEMPVTFPEKAYSMRAPQNQ